MYPRKSEQWKNILLLKQNISPESMLENMYVVPNIVGCCNSKNNGRTIGLLTKFPFWTRSTPGVPNSNQPALMDTKDLCHTMLVFQHMA